MAQLDELYLGDFEGFVTRRNEVATRLRADGDGAEADRVRGLKKPSRPAWAINQVSAGEAGLRDRLLAAGAALRQAQERLVAGKAGGAELRRASEGEQAAVSAMLEAVEASAAKAGAGLSPAAVERVRQTLHAVAREDAVRREFEEHRLTAEHEASGLDVLAGLPAQTGEGRAKSRTPTKDERREAKRSREATRAEAEARELGEREREAERDVGRAREAAEHAQQDLQRATETLDRAAKQAAAARARVEKLRRR